MEATRPNLAITEDEAVRGSRKRLDFHTMPTVLRPHHRNRSSTEFERDDRFRRSPDLKPRKNQLGERLAPTTARRSLQEPLSAVDRLCLADARPGSCYEGFSVSHVPPCSVHDPRAR
jgi:hypothetical protein